MGVGEEKQQNLEAQALGEMPDVSLGKMCTDWWVLWTKKKKKTTKECCLLF